MAELGIVAIIYDASAKARQQSAAIVRLQLIFREETAKRAGSCITSGNERTNFPSTSRQGLDPGDHFFPGYTAMKELTFPQHSSSEVNLHLFVCFWDICKHITCTCLFRNNTFILHLFF